MKTILQRVSRASVRVDGEVIGAVERGVLLLVAVERGDSEADAMTTARKIASLRIFPGRTPMDHSLLDVGGGCLVVSQFTIAGTVRKGRRPSFDRAALPDLANDLYERVVAALRAEGLTVATGRFAAHMEVELVNDGPVTIVIESRDGAIQ
ncbi:MAG: D-tyrosyl-tRNA(Tyr) deacylase [Myxococcales bacterium]|nr:D-tyrosyl-tRNA(Tyr) deacylase [Myxococcales bacterium]